MESDRVRGPSGKQQGASDASALPAARKQHVSAPNLLPLRCSRVEDESGASFFTRIRNCFEVNTETIRQGNPLLSRGRPKRFLDAADCDGIGLEMLTTLEPSRWELFAPEIEGDLRTTAASTVL
ncbi:hypothetical protein QR680_005700 [Steinernema hermaphroditum]|uniref:Uncharacterized protein n=1 Tax=Steinernema hermaphroditum TaxID=289476 RepID=A0AA39HT22_9BILA|nr:hypothetical protein QR680_005700 [Steinernema hermaphroditum]